jgi:hypothetical protein
LPDRGPTHFNRFFAILGFEGIPLLEVFILWSRCIAVQNRFKIRQLSALDSSDQTGRGQRTCVNQAKKFRAGHVQKARGCACPDGKLSMLNHS